MTAPVPNTKKSAFFARLREVAAEKPYLSFDRLKQVAAGRQIENIDTLKGYLGEAVDAGILNRAGRGWYSSLSRPARMPWDAGNPLPEILAERFPLLPHFVWFTEDATHYLGIY